MSKIKVNPISGIDYTGGATYVGGGGGSPVGNHENPYTTLAVQPLPPPPLPPASSSTDHQGIFKIPTRDGAKLILKRPFFTFGDSRKVYSPFSGLTVPFLQFSENLIRSFLSAEGGPDQALSCWALIPQWRHDLIRSYLR